MKPTSVNKISVCCSRRLFFFFQCLWCNIVYRERLLLWVDWHLSWQESFWVCTWWMDGSLALLWLVFALLFAHASLARCLGSLCFVFRIDNCCAILQTHNPPRMNLADQLYFSCRPVTPPRPLTRLLFERFTIKRPSHWISLSLWESITLFCCVCVCVLWTPGDHGLDRFEFIFSTEVH